MRIRFRFQKLDIWKRAVEIGEKLFVIADELEARKLYRYAEQLRGAGLSMSNNIAEGAGSTSNREFGSFLNFAKRSAFENANMVIMLARRGIISQSSCDELLNDLHQECQMITGFTRSLRRKATAKLTMLVCAGIGFSAFLLRLCL